MNTLITRLPLPLKSARQGQPIRHSWLARAGQSIWRVLEATGQARARRHLQAFADRCEPNQPELAKELRAASDQLLMG